MIQFGLIYPIALNFMSSYFTENHKHFAKSHFLLTHISIHQADFQYDILMLESG